MFSLSKHEPWSVFAVVPGEGIVLVYGDSTHRDFKIAAWDVSRDVSSPVKIATHYVNESLVVALQYTARFTGLHCVGPQRWRFAFLIGKRLKK